MEGGGGFSLLLGSECCLHLIFDVVKINNLATIWFSHAYTEFYYFLNREHLRQTTCLNILVDPKKHVFSEEFNFRLDLIPTFLHHCTSILLVLSCY